MNDLTIQTAVRYFLVTIVGRLLAAAGAALVAHGVTTSDQVAQQVGPLTQQIVGGVILLGTGAWAAYQARQKRAKELALSAAPASQVNVK